MDHHSVMLDVFSPSMMHETYFPDLDMNFEPSPSLTGGLAEPSFADGVHYAHLHDEYEEEMHTYHSIGTPHRRNSHPVPLSDWKQFTLNPEGSNTPRPFSLYFQQFFFVLLLVDLLILLAGFQYHGRRTLAYSLHLTLQFVYVSLVWMFVGSTLLFTVWFFYESNKAPSRANTPRTGTPKMAAHRHSEPTKDISWYLGSFRKLVGWEVL
eukprot:TRINITY_DN318_c0_g1_i2.p1 TRINITY_DN318_c0_g1~~TRINITY_DN318_c0_g1_i2.p1  ORF type:complete len:209 (+),score=21.68 TRINITY_DN318_c0_g1_i2:50-676(+)